MYAFDPLETLGSSKSIYIRVAIQLRSRFGGVFVSSDLANENIRFWPLAVILIRPLPSQSGHIHFMVWF
jgi:hypothetical protein